MNPLNNLPSAVSGAIPARAGFTLCDDCRRDKVEDHPRSRGVYSATAPPLGTPSGSSPLARGLRPAPGPWASDACGSSPLARGLPHVRHVQDSTPGIIPARAGFTRAHGRGSFPTRDHPRSRGVYEILPITTIVDYESSPLARGLRGPRRERGQGRRIIPARAGFTRTRRSAPLSETDHPRSRGVYGPCLTTPSNQRGSSPLARGLHRGHRLLDQRNGIIPARAGFTRRCGSGRGCRADHPRSRGVYDAARGVARRDWGSSPLARGLPLPGPRRRREAGIISARAGFTWCTVGRRRPRPDHPRSRGVYTAIDTHAGTAAGSSPLARGLLVKFEPKEMERRIIPARAGFTCRPRARPPPAPDHPRSRGVYRPATIHSPTPGGSSPLARGLRQPRFRRQ